MVEEMEHLYAELFEAAGVGRRFGERLAGTQGQTQARWQVLWTIEHAGRLTVPQTARRLGVTRQSVQRVVDDLLAERLVESAPNPDHKSSPLFGLTGDGRAVLGRINAGADAAHREILRDLPPEDVARLRSLLGRLTAATRAHDDV